MEQLIQLKVWALEQVVKANTPWDAVIPQAEKLVAFVVTQPEVTTLKTVGEENE
jgi:hypothetical protein